MMTEGHIVFIVDDDARIRSRAGMQPTCFASIRDLLEVGVIERPGCLTRPDAENSRRAVK